MRLLTNAPYRGASEQTLDVLTSQLGQARGEGRVGGGVARPLRIDLGPAASGYPIGTERPVDDRVGHTTGCKDSPSLQPLIGTDTRHGLGRRDRRCLLPEVGKPLTNRLGSTPRGRC